MTHDDAAPLLDGRYRVEGVIGQGGMSVVYRATDEVLRRPVAVKVFHSGSVDIARQDAELGVLASLEHHNLVGLLDAGVLTNADGAQQRFLVMSLVVGQDLEARLGVGPLAVRHIAEVGFDMAEALHYIHAHGVVHRDIKPSNILLVDYGHDADRARARLTDFGIAIAEGAERLTADGVTTGTAAYLSPEQARGGEVGPASDVYSLGLVLLQCFTRRREFPGSLVESALARLSRDPVVPEPLPEHWKEALRAMTAQDPAERPLGAELVAMLRDVVIADTSAPDRVVDPEGLEAPTAPITHVPAATGSGHAPAAEGDALASAPGTGAHAAPAVSDAHAADVGRDATGDRPATLDELPEEALHRTTAMAARLFEAPIALVEVLDEDREWSQSWIADGVDPAARKISFRNGFAPVPEPVVIPDGIAHPEMRDSPLVTGPLGIRFFVSVPLVRHDGTTIGTLAVLDVRPRDATEADLANLRDLAALAVAQLELRQETLRTTSDALPLDHRG
ncbi:protein kinase [Curtobacterium luteum]|uniref:protein kinase domain-containing protein n=1 Tax=Curtobacterium luteum TaxID=33881 RepID=UPI003801887C